MMTQAQSTSSRLRRPGRIAALLLALLVSACGQTPPPPHQPNQPATAPHPYHKQGKGVRRYAPSMRRQPEKRFEPFEEIKVALLLPLSGKSAELGQAMMDAASLGLFDKYKTVPKGDTRPRIVLIPKDTRGQAKYARRAAKAAIDEGAQLILGPLYSSSVEAVQPVAKQAGVNIISFSNNADVADSNTFLFGFMPEEQVKRVVGYAHQHITEDKRNDEKADIAALLPATDYGDLLRNALEDYASLQGIELSGIVQYRPGSNDMAAYAQQLSGRASGGRPVNIDALLLGEGGQSLRDLVSDLRPLRLGNNRVTYLGTGMWDDPDLLGTSSLRGSWFASSPRDSYRSFRARFEATHDYTPPRLASLGYDIVALAATLARRDGFDRETITAGRGFAGPANGIFRFNKDGTIERGLAVLELGRREFEELDPAPLTFKQRRTQ